MLKDRPALATILVVDDQEVVSRVLKRWLEHLGFAVWLATSAEQALGIMRQSRSPVDLILADVNMPRMDGLELARLVLADYPGRQIILMARRVGQLGERLLVRGRPVPVLAKPLNLDKLLDHLMLMLPPLLPAEEYEPSSAATLRR